MEIQRKCSRFQTFLRAVSLALKSPIRQWRNFSKKFSNLAKLLQLLSVSSQKRLFTIRTFHTKMMVTLYHRQCFIYIDILIHIYFVLAVYIRNSLVYCNSMDFAVRVKPQQSIINNQYFFRTLLKIPSASLRLNKIQIC